LLQEEKMKNKRLEQQANELCHKLEQKKTKYKAVKQENFMLGE